MIVEKRRQFIFLFYLLSIFVCSSILFLDGFFQFSRNQTRKTEEHLYENTEPARLGEYNLNPPLAKYDQIVLMIIDAWRLDYPNATNMPFSYKNACGNLHIKVNLPTVTMPRLKSITTGTISNFIDIVLNLGTASKLEDSILHRLTEKNKKSVFAGDRTWIQLFPDAFLRTVVNTDSFYVNDFYEGDLNITKSLEEELKNSDWNLMILHYLGLDHIGHVEGSHSDKIYEKLLEMDNIIEYITAHLNTRKLLLLTGDHGMRNGGSHGGSDKEELYVPLMSFQKNCYKRRSYKEYNQIDISATLAAMLDVKIPYTSIGCLIPEMLENYSKEEQLYLFYNNALHLMEKLKSRFNVIDIQNEDYFIWYEYAKTSHENFISSQAKSFLSYEKAKQNYIRLSKKVSQVLSESLVEYNIQQIFISLSLATLSAMKLLMTVLIETIPNSVEVNRFVWKKLFMCLTFTATSTLFGDFFEILKNQNIIISIIFTFQISLIIYFTSDICKVIFTLIIPPSMQKHKLMLKLSLPPLLLFLFLCHTLSLASSSYIEEEHQTWYYFTPSLLIFLTLQTFYNDAKSLWKNHKSLIVLFYQFWNLRSIFLVMMCLIGCRRLNQTGDKWRDVTDIGDVLSKSENRFYLNLTLVTGLVLLLLLLKKYNSPIEMIFCFISLFCVFLYRQSKQYSFLILLFFWISLICTQLRYCKVIFNRRYNFEYNAKGNLIQLLEKNLTYVFLISALLHRPHNVILLPTLMYTLENSYLLCDNLHIKDKRVYKRCYVLVFKTVITIFIANMFYFFQGNSNSLATIDLNPGYIGLSSYNPFIVGLFIMINTYCAPINSFLYLMWHMFSTQKSNLPLRQEKEQISDVQLMEISEEDLYLVYSLFIASIIMPVAVYWCLLVVFRYHLFIYSVFAPKAFYECLHLLVFYFNFIVTNLYFRIFIK